MGSRRRDMYARAREERAKGPRDWWAIYQVCAGGGGFLGGPEGRNHRNDGSFY